MAAALVRALGKTGHRDAEALLGNLSGGPSDVALAAVEAAKALGLNCAVIGNKALGHSDSEVVKQALLSYRGEVSDDDLVRLLAHPDWDVRLAAVQGCCQKGAATPILDALNLRVEEEENDLVRRAVEEALSSFERR